MLGWKGGDMDERGVNRRMAVTVLGGAVAAAWTGLGWPSVVDGQTVCTLTPEQMEGPYYLDLGKVRQDITEGKPGVPLRLVIQVREASPLCAPIAKAAVDVWHCDALGIYAGYEGAVVAPTHVQPVNDRTFLRGTQISNADGIVELRTIYPGWYTGRTTHVHVKVRIGTTAATTQLYFPEDVTAAVYRNAPYDQHPNRDTSNATDAALKAVSDKPLVMWHVLPAVGAGLVATATLAIKKA
jgi:protocatechuate 3,4-dioxygenase beta subunit